MLKFLSLVIILLIAPEGLVQAGAEEEPQTTTEETEEVESDSLDVDSISELVKALSELPIFVKDTECFSGIDTLRFGVYLEGDTEKILSEDEVRVKFEVNLRKYGVPIVYRYPDAPALALVINSVRDDDPSYDICAYTVTGKLLDRVMFYRGDKKYYTAGIVWSSGSFGYAGNRNLARQEILRNVELLADKVANLYLSAN